MGQVVRDIGMTMLVALVVHALYSARHTRRPPAGPEASVYAASAAPAVPQASEQPPAGFSVFPWAP